MKAFSKYSQFYDSLYKSKDYKSEVDFIDEVIKKYLITKGNDILSLGCGTCSHDILLANKGYNITGVDQSESMLAIAREKIKENNLGKKISLIKSDVSTMKLEKKFDVAMAMFNVIGYQTTNDNINGTISSTYNSLKKDGLFFFDCWYAPAVMKEKPTDRIREIVQGSTKTIRLTQSVLNTNTDTIDISFHVMEIKDNKVENDVHETHSMRYWSLPEIQYMLDNHGFDLIRACKYMELDSSANDDEWNMFVIAKKK